MRSACARTAALFSACVAGNSFAQIHTLVLPLGAETTAGITGNSIPLGNFSSGVLQVMYAADQMASVPPGSAILGIQMRQWNNASTGFPASSLVLPKFWLTVGTSTQTPATMSTNFASNLSGAVAARAGTLSLAAGAYPGGAATGTTPEGWGPTIAFTNPFYYIGGPLVMEFRTENPASASNFSADVFSAPGKVAFVSNSPSTATSGPFVQQNQGVVVQLTYLAPTQPFQKGITRLLIQDELANAAGSSTNSFPLDVSARTIQLIADAGEMRRLGLGSRFVGLFYRNAQSGAWPTGAQAFTKYDIRLARALNTPTTMSDTISLNAGPDSTLVRSGVLNIQAGALAGVSSPPHPAPWTLEIPFTTPYTYLGGPLFTLVRHDGVSGGNFARVAGTLFSDSLYGTRVRGRSSNTASSVLATTDITFSYTSQLWSIDSGSVVPNANTAVRGPSTLQTVYSDTERTSQFIVNASELTYLPVGSRVTGITFRSRSSGAAPAAGCLFENYQVYVSTAANRPATASAVFASNEGADKVQVKSGAFYLAPGSLPGSLTVNAFGPTIEFDRAFVYQGGDICVTIRHSGNGTEAVLIDGNSDVSLTRTISAAGIGATSGALATGGPIVRIEFDPSVVAPAAVDNTPGQDGYAVFYTAAGNVLQSVYSAEQLRGLRVGSLITGMSMRRYSRSSGGPDWPVTDTSVGRFDVTLSTSPVLPQAMSDTFAANIGADAILVRSGPMTIPAGAFPYVQSDSRPNENRWFIQFTEPFVYRGGALSVTIRNNYGIVGSTIYADAYFDSPSVASGRWAVGAGPDATMHNQAGFTGALALRFAFVPRSYCPADLNNDGIVEDGDFTEFLAAYNILDCADGAMEQGCPADFNFDRVVDDSDFVKFLAAYNTLVCP
ncbi:MAG: hypothetical protein KF805_05580 [Phycisphaeraceae bacterium]|nr:hypothetical protein [Phycisphaeraceae bacterium]